MHIKKMHFTFFLAIGKLATPNSSLQKRKEEGSPTNTRYKTTRQAKWQGARQQGNEPANGEG
jgi:hypothetical protein